MYDVMVVLKISQHFLAVFDDKNPDRNTEIYNHLKGDERLDPENYSNVIKECEEIIGANPEKKFSAKYLKSLLIRVQVVWDDFSAVKSSSKIPFTVAIMSQR